MRVMLSSHFVTFSAHESIFGITKQVRELKKQKNNIEYKKYT